VLRATVEEIKVANYFSIIVDSTPDVSHVDQLRVARFLLLDNVGHTSERMKDAVLSFMNENDMDIKNRRGLNCETASMFGVYRGLQARLKAIHSLDLVGKSAAEAFTEIL
jgi:hypothetical protein